MVLLFHHRRWFDYIVFLYHVVANRDEEKKETFCNVELCMDIPFIFPYSFLKFNFAVLY
jgi:hypothetical protein